MTQTMTENYWSQLARREVGRRGVLQAAVVGGAGLAGAALIGCGGGSSSGGTATATKAAAAAPGAAATAAVAAKPRFGGKHSSSTKGDPPGWSVFTASHLTARMNSFPLEKLLEFKAGPGVPPNSTDLIPGLATALPEQPDGQTYVFKIRQGVKFQNVAPVNGRPMAVEDVKYAIDTMRTNKAFQADFTTVTSVEATDAQTLVVKTKAPYAPFLPTSVGQYGWPIFPKEIIDSKLTDNTAIGTGAYIRAEWQQGSKIVFKKNPDYWNKDLGFIDEITFLVMPDPNAEVAAFTTKQIDSTGGQLAALPCELTTGVKGVQVQSYVGTTASASWDTTKPPFNDVRVRRAVSLLYNHEAEGQAVYCGSSAVVGLLTGARALKPAEIPDLANYLKVDVKQAKDLLAAAGFPNGFKADIAFTPEYGQVYTTALDRFIGDAKQGGITLNPVSYEYGKWIAEIYRPPYNWTGMCWSGNSRSYPDPDQEARRFLYPGENTNQSRVNDPAMTALIDKQAIQLNVNERWATLHEIQRLEAKNMYHLWKGTGDTRYLMQNRLHDFVDDMHYSSHKFLYAWVDA
ncbi:MAG: ABC transporter substrate-binding protein [Vicinamibacterales bacterium]|nr:ABC transporter substrate-binding protein [Vicinamibacterales bacterium]